MLPDPLTARIEDASGNALPRVPVVWQPSAFLSLSKISFVSDANGIVFATVTLGPTAGATQVHLRTVSTDSTPFGASNNIVTTLFSVTVGAATTPPPTPGLGQPATLRILSGDLQSGQPGAQLPVRLTARVEDSSGNPLPNVPVMWQSSQAVSLSNVSSTSDGSGIVSATATLGSITGPAQVQLRAAGVAQTPFGPASITIQANFNLSVGGVPTGNPGQAGAVATLLVVSGNNQSGPPNTRLAG